MLHGRRRNPVASRWAVQVWFDDTVQCQNAICGLDVWGRMSFKIWGPDTPKPLGAKN
jgi:hypothetical protein